MVTGHPSTLSALLQCGNTMRRVVRAGIAALLTVAVPGLAVSLRATRGDYDFRYAAQAAAALAEAMLRRPLPARTFLNVNVPKGQPKGWQSRPARNRRTCVRGGKTGDVFRAVYPITARTSKKQSR